MKRPRGVTGPRKKTAGSSRLPRSPTPIIGRHVELSQALDQLRRPEVRLLTLTGPPGVGKTRIALQVAADLADEYEGGAAFVDLAPLTEPELVVQVIAQTLGVIEAPHRPLLEQICEHLADTCLLMVLDNFEQVIGAAAQVRELLAGALGSKILVTSREPLQLLWEQQLPVEPLRLPDLTNLPRPAELARFPSVELFLTRARAVDPGFVFTPNTGRTVAEICTRLDGLPLAIELAAVRVKVLTPETILERLEHRLSLLTQAARDMPERHRTLRGAIGWSYALLAPTKQALFRRLGVFSGGATLQAVGAVCESGPEADLLGELASLVDQSLVLRDISSAGEARFRMLETIREFALEQLEATGELPALQRRHAEFFAELAERAEPELHGPDQLVWLDRLEREHDNLRGALPWLLECDDPDLVLRLTRALWWFWEIRGYWKEGRAWMDAALTRRGPQSPTMRARTLAVTALLASAQDDIEQAQSLAVESLNFARASGEKSTMALALMTLGILAFGRASHEEAAALLRDSLALFEEAGPPWAAAWAGIRLGMEAHILGDPGAAALMETGLARFRKLGDAWGTARAIGALGSVALHRGDYARAKALLEESLQLRREYKDATWIAFDLQMLGNVALLQHDFVQARALFASALKVNATVGNKASMTECVEGLARVAVATRQWDRAAILFGAAEAFRETIDYWAEPIDKLEYESAVKAIHDSMPEDTFAASWTKGRAMSFDATVEYALGEDAVTSGEPAVRPSPTPLTKREDEVAALIAEGLTNREIARRLFVSEETAATHVKHILRKLDVRSRAQIAGWSVERSLRKT